jgi:hypothetical protein
MSTVDFESTETFEEPNDQVVTPPVPTEDEIREQGFDDGLNEISGIEPEKPVVKDVVPVVPSLQTIAGYTEDELKAILDKARRVDDLEAKIQKMHADTASQHGIMKQQLKELKSQKTVKPTISTESFSKLSEYTDDPDLVEALVAGLETVTLSSSPANQLELDIEDINTRLNEHIETRLTQERESIRQELAREAFEERHPGWQSDIESAEYAHWKSTLKPEALLVVNSTKDWREAGRALDGFKSWKSKKADAELKKQQRLASNLSVDKVPGRSQSGPTDDDFNAGLKSVIGGRK